MLRPYARLVAGCHVICIFLACAAPVRNASAQSAAENLNAQRAAFTAGKLNDFTPNFTLWAKAGDEYLNAPPESKAEVLAVRVRILQTAFASFNPDNNPIRVVTKVEMKWDPAGADPDSTPEQRTVTACLPDPPGMFSFVLPDMQIDIVVPELEHGAAFTLSPDDFRQFLAVAGQGKHRNGMLELRLQAVKANVAAPGQVEGKTDWPVIGSILRVTLWDDAQERVLWEYDSPFDRNSDKAVLQSLYKLR